MTETRRRTYDEGCLAAHALDLIGDRWALLIARELMLGTRRFGELRGGLPGISANVLTQRLEEMERDGLVSRHTLAGPVRVQVYGLTEAGQGLWPIIRALCLWGVGQPGHDPHRFISASALMLSMRVLCNRTRAGSHLAEFRLGEDVFTIRTMPGEYQVTRGAKGAGMRFSGAANAMAGAVYGPRPLAEAQAMSIEFSGDIVEGQAFIDLFALRPPAAPSNRAVQLG